MYGKFANTRPQACPCCQCGGSCHAITSRDEQGMPHFSLVTIVIPPLQQGTDVILLQHAELTVRFSHVLLRQSYVEYFQLT